MTKRTYEQWITAVDIQVGLKIGVSVQDLTDYPLRDLYDQGLSPANAAAKIVRTMWRVRRS